MITAADLGQRLSLRKLKREWRGACPACGYAAAFSVRAGEHGAALAWCASCQDQDGIEAALNRVTAGAWKPPERPDQQSDPEQRAKKQAAALRLWSGSAKVPGTLGERYLAQRGLATLSTSPALRFREDCYHPHSMRLPAVVAQVVDVDGRPVAVHRTYLDRSNARKTTHEPAKASLGPVWHAAVRLQPLEPGQPLVIGEGIETSASAGLMIGAPAWAAISCGNLQYAMQLPPEATDIIIATDKDDPGERAAQSAACRWQAEGRQVRIARPNGPGDFNHQLLWDAHHG
ncbi:DUF7146 domain-containing protein [Lichenicoccus sp.]|uniref:DUF7146 domain-containing protein n=1 Tax=Lichenicoccus sp. TaxID=2781899 RepID=UPI003D0CDF1E